MSKFDTFDEHVTKLIYPKYLVEKGDTNIAFFFYS